MGVARSRASGGLFATSGDSCSGGGGVWMPALTRLSRTFKIQDKLDCWVGMEENELSSDDSREVGDAIAAMRAFVVGAVSSATTTVVGT